MGWAAGELLAPGRSLPSALKFISDYALQLKTKALFPHKEIGSGTSLVARWLRLRALPMQGTQVRSLFRELGPTCMLQLRVHMPQLSSPCAATKEPVSCTCGSLPAATKTWRDQINK